jgi:hypothetical protein
MDMAGIRVAGALALAVVSAGVGGPTATGAANATINISGHVPLTCTVNFAGGSGAFNEAGVARLGSTAEFCNNAQGYRLYAYASPDAADGALLVNGRQIALAPGREVLIAENVSPARTSRAIDYLVAEGEGGGSVTLRIEAR